MKTYLNVAAAALIGMAFGASANAEPGGPGAEAMIGKSALDPGRVTMRTLTCVVNGTPTEFPNDLAVRNLTSSAIGAGTNISWTVNPSIKGTYKLTAALGANQTAHLANVVPGGLPAGTPCSAMIVIRAGG